MPGHRFALIATAAACATLGATTAAHAAPDWSPAAPLPSAASPWQTASVAFDGDSTMLAATTRIVTVSPFVTQRTVVRREPGGSVVQELAQSSSGNVHPLESHIVARDDGSAVLAASEGLGATAGNLLGRWSVRMRRPNGTWEAAVPLAADAEPSDGSALTAVMGPDGTAAVAVAATEADGQAEPQTDRRIWVAIRRPGASWTVSVATPANTDAAFPDLGIDAAGNVTLGYASRFSEGATDTIGDDMRQAVVRTWTASNGVWGSAIDLSPALSSREANAPEIGVAPDGRAVAAWQDEANGFKLRAALRDASGAWADSATIVMTGSTSAPRDAGMSPAGTAYVQFGFNGSSSSQHYVGIARAIGGSWVHERVSDLGTTGRGGVVGFLGNDAFATWGSTVGSNVDEVLQAARWRPGAPAPEGRRDLVAPGADPGSPTQLVPDNDGSIVALFARDSQVWAAAWDAGPPRQVGGAVPATGVVGQPVSMSATFTDLWSPLAGDVSWSFGDGATATGGSVQHTYGAPGTYTVTARRSDARGNQRAVTSSIAVAAAPAPAAAPPAPAVLPPAPSRGTPAGSRDVRAPRMKLGSTKLTMDRRGRLALRLSCPADETGGCRGTAALERPAPRRRARGAQRRRVTSVGKGTFRLRGGSTSVVRVTVPRKARSSIRRAGRRGLPVTLVLQAGDAAGNRTTSRTAVRLVSARRR